MPVGQVSRWQARTMMQPSASIAAVPNEYSSAPSSAAIITSRPVLNPPSTRIRTRERRPSATSARCASASPSSHGMPGVLDRRQRRRAGAAVRARRPARRPPAPLTTPPAIVPMPASATSFTETSTARVDLLQVEDQLGEILDRVDVVVRRRRDQRRRRAGCAGAARSRRSPCARELAALARLRALRHLDVAARRRTRSTRASPRSGPTRSA